MSARPPEETNNLNLELRGGAIILTLEDVYALLTPEQATAIGDQMARYAYEADSGIEPKTKSQIAERIKTKMVTRCGIVIKNEVEKGTNHLKIANMIVDIILSEAL